MYENNNTVSIDWKGLFIKLIVVALIVFAIFKGYEYFSNKKGNSTSTPSAATQLFNANLESLRQAGENYYDYSNYPEEGQTVMVTLAELVTKGDIKELYDANGNECSGENSYVALTNDNGQYKLKATLSCGETSNYTVVMIGCECEGDECAQAIKKLEDEKESKSESSTSSSSSKSSSSNKTSSSKSSSSKNKNTNNTNASNKTTRPKSTQVVDMSQEYPNRPNKENNDIKNDYNNNNNNSNNNNHNNNNNTQLYTVTFDTNGGDDIEKQYVYKNDTAYEPEDPERGDDRFVGWYYNGKLFDFDTKITKNITLEAYYWDTKTKETQVYSAAWDTYGTNYVTVTHQLAIPQQLQSSNIKNVKIKTIKSERSISSYSDVSNYVNNHRTTYELYNYNNTQNNYNLNLNYYGYMTYINAQKAYYGEYDRWVTWTAYTSRQCSTPFTFDGVTSLCNYGIVYTVVWEYDILTD